MFYLLIVLLQMKILKTKNDLKKAILNTKNLGFVPTMGSLHEGHISLIKKSKKNSEKTLVSIYINPTQFNKKKDFKSYPRNINDDIIILKKMKVDFLFIPNSKQIYNNKFKVNFKLPRFERIMCANFRKGHFEGVLEVMDRLLNIVKPKNLFLGQKDYQQQYLINKYLKKKHKFRLFVCKTIRNKYLALSSRNLNLSKELLSKANYIAKELFKIKRKYRLKKFRSSYSISFLKNLLNKKYQIKIDYLEFRNPKNLKKTDYRNKFRLFIAYNINGIRLIDNI